MKDAKPISSKFLEGVNAAEECAAGEVTAEQWKRTAADMYAYKEITRRRAGIR